MLPSFIPANISFLENEIGTNAKFCSQPNAKKLSLSIQVE